jgi:hypothetical protein
MSRKLVSYRLADDLQQALKERASLEGISATELVNRLLRQGLTSQDTLSPTTETRLSRLEQVMHQLEERVKGIDDAEAVRSVPSGVGNRLQEVEKKLDALTAGVEEGCRSLRRLNQVVQATLPPEQHQQTAAIHRGDSSEPNTYGGGSSQDVVPVSLEALRQLLKSDS